MRDPARINRIIDKLWLAWKQVPDQRLGQLLINIGHLTDPVVTESNIWVTEDDKWEAAIDYWLSD